MSDKIGVSGASTPDKPNRWIGATMTPPSDYRLIPLTQGKWAKVDCEDFDHLNQWKWYALWNAHTRSFYARRATLNPNHNRQTIIRMHNVVVSFNDLGGHSCVDHINHDTLDNRRVNLRIASKFGNAQNSRLRKDSRTGFKGVAQRGSSWQARIRVRGERIHLGTFSTPQLAYQAYCDAAAKFHGEYAYVHP